VIERKTAQAIVHELAAAMYQAKEAGRNGIRFFNAATAS
jgi:GGDEF domain-containing protein